MILDRILSAAFALTLAACSQANAQEDMRAVYEWPDGSFRMTIEMQADGDLRGQTQGQAMTLLKVRGRDFLVFPGNGGAAPRVLDVAIMAELMDEAVPPELRAMMEQGPQISIELEAAGTLTTNTWEGTAYRMASSPPGSPPAFVISEGGWPVHRPAPRPPSSSAKIPNSPCWPRRCAPSLPLPST